MKNIFKRKKKYKNIIFDFDDTLAPCSKFYIEAKTNFCNFQKERLDISLEISERIFNAIDLACIDLPDGFNRMRYPRSFAATSAVLDIVTGNPPNVTAAKKSFDFGDSVFNAEYNVFPNVIRILNNLKNNGHEIFLWTKGDTEIQQSKITHNKLEEVFGKDHIRITMYKTSDGMADFMNAFNMNPVETLMVGDSKKDDVGCAIANGIDSVLIQHDMQKWGYEDKDHAPTYTIDHVTHLPTLELFKNEIFTDCNL